jgi:hypothetical protein
VGQCLECSIVLILLQPHSVVEIPGLLVAFFVLAVSPLAQPRRCARMCDAIDIDHAASHSRNFELSGELANFAMRLNAMEA